MKKSRTGELVKNSKPNTKLPIRRRLFQLPEQYLNQLEEFSSGGYFLIIFDEIGVPQPYNHFDSPKDALAMVKFCKDYFTELDFKLSRTIRGNASSDPILEEESEED